MIKQTLLSRVLFVYTQRALRGVLVFVLLAALVVIGALQTNPAVAAPNDDLNFQARLQNGAGAIVPDGYYNVEFKLYDDLTSGSLLWTETYKDLNGVTAGSDYRVRVANGYLTVSLGSLTAFPGSIDWSEQYYITMNIGGTAQTATPTWDGEMSPRLKLTSVPYAFRSGFADTATGLQATGANQSTVSWASQTALNSIVLPDASGTICLQGSTSCNFAAASGSANYIQNTTSPQTADFNITGSGTLGGFTNSGSTLNTTLALGNFASGGSIGAASTTVDAKTSISINQTTAGQTLTLPSPTNTAAGRVVYISNVGSVSFTMGGISLSSGAAVSFIWNGSAWTPSSGSAGSGISTIGTIDSETKSANGAVINGTSLVLQTADISNVGMVSTSTQTFAGDKTFAGALTANGSGTGLVVTNAATIGGALTVGTSGQADTFTKLSDGNLSALPSNSVYGAAWSPDGQYMSATSYSTPYIYIYKRSGDTFTKLANPSTLPANSAYATAWSPDGQYMSVAHTVSPFITIYKRSGDTFTKLTNPSSLPANVGTGTAWSPDGQYMTVSHLTTPFITIYKRSGDTFTKLTNPSSLPAGNGNATAWSPDGQYMTVAHSTSPYVTTYKRNGDTFTKLGDPATLPAGNGYATAWSPDGQYMTVAHASSPFITIYKRSGDTFTKLTDPANLPGGTSWSATGVSWSPDAQYMTVGYDTTSPYMITYKRSGDTFTKLTDPATAPADSGYATAWSPDGKYLTVGAFSSPYIAIYKRSFSDTTVYGNITSGGSVTGALGQFNNLQVLGASTLNGATYVNGALSVAGDTVANGNISLAAGKTLTVTGDVTANRPASPTEGMVYYDTTTKQLLTYSNGKWQADRTSATKIVAASNSSQALKDSADYVADGEDSVGSGIGALDGDQVQINSALSAVSALGGGTVYLHPGTYTLDAQISVPNNVTISGAGSSTLIQLGNFGGGAGLTFSAIQNSDTTTGTNIGVKNLRIDGRRTLNTGTTGLDAGVKLSDMGEGTGSSMRTGAVVENVSVYNFVYYGIYLTDSENNVLRNVHVQNTNMHGLYLAAGSNRNTIEASTMTFNDDYGFYISGGTHNTFTGNKVHANNDHNIYINDDSNVISNNVVSGGTDDGIQIYYSDYNVVSNNKISGVGTVGITLQGADNNAVTGNSVSTSTQDGIYLSASDYNLVSSNLVSSNTRNGIYVYTGNDYNNISSNQLFDNGGSAGYSGINVYFTNSYTTITGNTIRDTAGTGYAIDIDSNPTNTYLADNVYSGTGASSINDLSTTTTYGSQKTASNILQNSSTRIKATASNTLSGTGAIAATTTLTGTSTTFTTALQTGDRVTVNGETRMVTAIASNTSLTVDRAFATTASGQTITRLPAALVVATSAGTAKLVIDESGNAVFSGAQLTNTGSTLNTALTIGNFPSGGSIGTAAATVDVATTIRINQSTAGQTLTLPNPTDTTPGRIVYIVANGGTSFTMGGTTVASNGVVSFVWIGSAWSLAGGAGSGISAVGTIDSLTKSANGAVISGSDLILQTADVTYPGLVSTTTQSFAGNKTFTGTLSISGAGTALSVTNSASIGGDLAVTGNITVGAGKSLSLAGGNTASRPGSPTEGMIYFDTTTKQLLVYSNGKWQADRSTSTKIVAASNSSQALKDSADYVADGEDSSGAGIGTLDGDQVQINAALTAAASAGGGTVYLLAGTYTIDDEILMPNNVTLAGSGTSSLVQFGNFGSTAFGFNAIDNSDTTTGAGIVIRDFKIDGRVSINTNGGLSMGIYAYGIGDGTGSTARQGITVQNMQIVNLPGNGIRLRDSDGANINSNQFQNIGLTSGIYNGIYLTNNSSYARITNNAIYAAGNNGIEAASGSVHNIISNNEIHSSGTNGIAISDGYNTITGNKIYNGDRGMYVYQASYSTITGNSISGVANFGIQIFTTASVNVSSNMVYGSGSYGVYNLGVTYSSIVGNTIRSGSADGLYLPNSNNHHNTITGNTIMQNAGSGLYIWDSPDNTVSSNVLYDNTGSGADSSIRIRGTSHNSKIVNNSITDTAGTGYAILVDSSATNTYLADNNYSGTGAATISDGSTSTVYASQLTPSNILQTSSTNIKSRVSAALSGTGAIAATTTLTGTSTTFTTALQIGDRVTVNSETRMVTAIASNTSLTVDRAFTTTASGQTITRLPAALVVATSAGTAKLVIDDNGNAVFNGDQLTVAGSTLNTASALGDLASGAIGTAAATVDVKTNFTINPTAGSRAYTLPSPTDTRAGRTITIMNISAYSFTVAGTSVTAGGAITFLWNGSAWSPTGSSGGSGISTVGTIDSQTKSANGAVISGSELVLQTADVTYPGLVSTTTQSFAGNKTFTGTLSISGAGTALSVTNDATIGGTLGVTGAVTLSSTLAVLGDTTIGSTSNADTFTKLSDPASLPAGTGLANHWSPDGVYMTVAHSTSPYITIYKRSGDTFTKLSDPSTLPTGTARGVAWSPNGVYMTVAHSTSPYITIYKRSGDTFTKLSNPAYLPPTWAGNSVAWSPDGQYMSYGVSDAPYIVIYKRTGDTFTKLNDPATLPSNWSVFSTTWSPDGQHLVIGFDTSPYIMIYKRSGDTLTKLSDPGTLPVNTVYGVSYSVDGQYLSVAHLDSPYITIYKRTGDTYTKLSDPATLPPAQASAVAFSPDGVYLNVSHNSSPYITIYKRSGDTFTKLSNPASLPAGNSFGTAWSPDGKYLSAVHATSPFVTIYKRGFVEATVNGNITSNGEVNATSGNFDGLSVTGTATLGGSIVVAGGATISSNLSVAGTIVGGTETLNDTFTKLSNPATLPTTNSYNTAFSPDGVYTSVAHASSPYVTIYKRSGDTFTKLSNPASLPAGDAYATAWSSDGQYLSVGHETSPYVTIYKRSGDTFTKLSNPASLPAAAGYATAFSQDGSYMSVAHATSPYITIYKRSGDTFTKLSNPASLPASTAFGTSFSPDGTYMSVAHTTTPYVTIYKRSGDTFTKLSDPASLPAGQVNGASWSSDGQYLTAAHTTTPFIAIYKRSGDTFTKLSDPATLPGGTGNSASFSPDNKYVSVAHATTPYVTIYVRGYMDAAIYGSMSIAGNVSTSSVTANSGSFASLVLANPDGTSGVVLSAGGIRLSGSARNTKSVVVTPEYTGAVLDGSGSGTMTAGYDSTARKNYYNWNSTSGTAQTYSIVLTYATPSDWSGWAPSSSICIDTWTSSTSNATGTIHVTSTDGTVTTNNGSITPGSTSTWTNTCVSPADTNFSADGTMVIKFNMTAQSSANFRVGNLTLKYLSQF